VNLITPSNRRKREGSKARRGHEGIALLTHRTIAELNRKDAKSAKNIAKPSPLWLIAPSQWDTDQHGLSVSHLRRACDEIKN